MQVMEFYEVIRSRRSVRHYTGQQVPEDALRRLLEAARWAPSWHNSQPWEFVIVRRPDIVAALKRERFGLLISAPTYIVACGDPRRSGTRDGLPYFLVDVACAMEHLMLAACAEGLGTCWIGGMFKEQRVKKLLEIPEQTRVVGITPLGYPRNSLAAAAVKLAVNLAVRSGSRKPLVDFVHYDAWRGGASERSGRPPQGNTPRA